MPDPLSPEILESYHNTLYILAIRHDYIGILTYLTEMIKWSGNRKGGLEGAMSKIGAYLQKYLPDRDTILDMAHKYSHNYNDSYAKDNSSMIQNIDKDFKNLIVGFNSGELTSQLIFNILDSNYISEEALGLLKTLTNLKKMERLGESYHYTNTYQYYHKTETIFNSHLGLTMYLKTVGDSGEEYRHRIFEILLPHYNAEAINKELSPGHLPYEDLLETTKALLDKRLAELMVGEENNNRELLYQFIMDKKVWCEPTFDAEPEQRYQVITEYLNNFIYKSPTMSSNVKEEFEANINALLVHDKNKHENQSNALSFVIGRKVSGLTNFIKLYKQTMERLSPSKIFTIPLSFYLDVFKCQLNSHLFNDALNTLEILTSNKLDEYENNKARIYLFVQRLYIHYHLQRSQKSYLSASEFTNLKEIITKIKSQSYDYFSSYDTAAADDIIKGSTDEVIKVKENLAKLDELISIYEQYYLIFNPKRNSYDRTALPLDWYREFLDCVYSDNLYQLNQLFSKGNSEYVDLYALFLELPLISFQKYYTSNKTTPLQRAISKKDIAMAVKINRWTADSKNQNDIIITYSKRYQNFHFGKHNAVLKGSIASLINYFADNLSIKQTRQSLWVLQDRLECISSSELNKLDEDTKNKLELLKPKLEQYLKLSEHLQQKSYKLAKKSLNLIQENSGTLNCEEQRMFASREDIKLINEEEIRSALNDIKITFEEIKESIKASYLINYLVSDLNKQHNFIAIFWCALKELPNEEQLEYLKLHFSSILDGFSELITILLGRANPNGYMLPKKWLPVHEILKDIHKCLSDQCYVGIIANNKAFLADYRKKISDNGIVIDTIVNNTSSTLSKIFAKVTTNIQVPTSSSSLFSPKTGKPAANGVLTVKQPEKKSDALWEAKL